MQSIVQITELLPRLEAVRKQGCGYMARCPAHQPDRNPSLSVREGDRGILLTCWAGCELSAICAAIGITTRQLFFDDNGPVDRHAIRQYQARRQATHARQQASGRRVDALREAECVLRAATNLNISGWSNEQLDAALNRVCDAHDLLLREDTADATQHEPAEV